MVGVERWRVRVLGPVRVLDPSGEDVTPEGALQRRLLALLLLYRGSVVTVDAAVDALWPVQRPRDPVAALQNHVSRLRRALPEELIESTGEGYRLAPDRVEIDADQLAARLRSDSNSNVSIPDSDQDEIEQLLEQWHGPAYPELAEVDDARSESTRLEELRIRATEVLAESRLAAGDTDGLVAELAALADAEPLRERPRSLLMSALAATGRHVEALRVYDDFRRLLGDELGIEPSPVLTAQHADLLDGRGDSGAGARATSGWVPTTQLPIPTTSLVGREALVAGAAALLAERRMVTFVGPGGVGKTRLAIEVGHRLQRSRPARPVVMCELATAVDDAALDVVAAALGIDTRPGVSPVERIASVLGDTDVVIVIDNCEQVLDTVAALAEGLLTTCPNVTLLATSRERLRVSGEQLFAVPPLLAGTTNSDTSDEPTNTAPAEGGSPAVELFVERARAVVPGFDPDTEELQRIAQIVQRLDGLPLAIELAAARLHTHDLAEVAAGLDHRFELLTSGYRSSARHGSLHAAVAWSYGLLDPRLRTTFASLSVFVGSFTAVDAAAICATSAAAVSTDLAELTERSLLTRAAGRRYVMLETLRAFGAEQLSADGDRVEQIVERHARYHVDWVEQADRDLVDQDRSTLADIDAALPELRVALDRMLERGEVDTAGRLVARLLNYSFLRLRPDVLGWSERVIASDPGDAGAYAALTWVAAAYAAWMAGDTAACGERAARARSIDERSSGDGAAEVAEISASHALFEGRLDESLSWYRIAAERAEAAGDRVVQLMMEATELLALGYAAEGRATGAAAGHPAADRAAELLARYEGRTDPCVAYLWYCAGEAVMALDVDLARDRFARAVELGERANASFVVGVASASLASIDARLGDPLDAAAEYRRLIHHWRRAGMWATQWTMLRSIAALLARLGRMRQSAVLAGAIWATESGHRIFGADEVALGELGDELRTALGEDEYRAALTEGAALDGDAAIEHALQSL